MPMLIMPTEAEPGLDAVRTWARGALRELPRPARPAAALVVDELVDNARRHGRAPYVLRLDLDEDGNRLLVSVDDCAPALGARAWPTGAGLVLVAGLAERWGVEPRRSAKTVWAELAFDPADPGGPVPWPRARGRRTRP